MRNDYLALNLVELQKEIDRQKCLIQLSERALESHDTFRIQTDRLKKELKQLQGQAQVLLKTEKKRRVSKSKQVGNA